MASKLSNENLAVFNKRDRVIAGWYWALRASKLKKNKPAAVTVNGKDLVLFRDPGGAPVALDAYCPHRGSHLALGTLEEGGVRCGYHRWLVDKSGAVTDIPCIQGDGPKAHIEAYPVVEKYGMIWVYTGTEAKEDLPFVPPELEGQEILSAFAPPYKKKCHPSVVMCDAIDAQHFHAVHGFDGSMLDMEATVDDEISMRVENRARMPKHRWITRLLSRFYKNELTYALKYWYGTTGTVTVGPDFLHAYIMFTNRLGPDGSTEGQTILLTKHRKGPIGWVINKVALAVTWVVGAYFAYGDTPQFNTIRFDFKTPIKEDHALITFIQHVEKQPVAKWGYGDERVERLPTPAVAGKKPPRLQVVSS